MMMQYAFRRINKLRSYVLGSSEAVKDSSYQYQPPWTRWHIDILGLGSYQLTIIEKNGAVRCKGNNRVTEESTPHVVDMNCEGFSDCEFNLLEGVDRWFTILCTCVLCLIKPASYRDHNHPWPAPHTCQNIIFVSILLLKVVNPAKQPPPSPTPLRIAIANHEAHSTGHHLCSSHVNKWLVQHLESKIYLTPNVN
jgi:hypothetical protein